MNLLGNSSNIYCSNLKQNFRGQWTIGTFCGTHRKLIRPTHNTTMEVIEVNWTISWTLKTPIKATICIPMKINKVYGTFCERARYLRVLWDKLWILKIIMFTGCFGFCRKCLKYWYLQHETIKMCCFCKCSVILPHFWQCNSLNVFFIWVIT